MNRRIAWLASLAGMMAASAAAAEPGGGEGPFYSPSLNAPAVKHLYWGDTHVHTNLSPDAAAGGNVRFGHDELYRLARGDAVTAHSGRPVKLNRPLDFLVAADHAEYMGLFPALEAGDARLLATAIGQRWHAMHQAGPEQAAQILVEFGEALSSRKDLLQNPAYNQSVWKIVTEQAERYNDPGRFTALIGYEWSSGRGGGNMHRIVVFQDGAKRAGQVTPFSSFDGDRPRELWRFLADYEARTGGRALAIPHNSNTSAGLMFALTDSDGEAITADYARLRARWEPLTEVTQFKGDSETHPYVSPNDEFAEYESWDRFAGFSTRPHEDAMFAAEYVRPALRTGLAMWEDVGVNPYKFGLIGSTDSHTGIPSADENNFWGKFSWHEPSAERALEPFVNIPDIVQLEWEMAASGYAAVWAEANTRECIFAALARKETYATTGPRLSLRVFGGWHFEAADLERPDWVAAGYARGVPMGGDLPVRQQDVAPAFMVQALKDPMGANLDRVQIVKGWLQDNGETAERVYDVALSDGRRLDAQSGKAPPVGSTVDVATATYSNSIGAAALQTVWRDPDFNPAQAAFYYVRVLEIPTPRWTAFDAAFFKTRMPPEVPLTTQERAYGSPIWYVPKRGDARN